MSVARTPEVVAPVVVGGLHPSMTRLLRDLRLSLREDATERRKVAERGQKLDALEAKLLPVIEDLLAKQVWSEDDLGKVVRLVEKLVQMREANTRMGLQLAKATDAKARLHSLLTGGPTERTETLHDLSDAELKRLVLAGARAIEGEPKAVGAGETTGAES